MEAPESRSARWGDLWRIAVVMLLGLTLRVWIVSHTEVAARDSIGFIRYALTLENPPEGQSPLDVIRRELHPPGYVSLVMLVSWPVRAITGETTADTMVLSCQIVSVLSAMLLVIPMYFLGRRLFDQQTAFIGCGIFQVLPVCAQITSDGLSDGLYLLTGITTLWLAVRAFESPGFGRFFLAGMGSGAAYLIRPEGLLFAGATGLTVLLLAILREIALRPMLVRGLAVTGGVLLVGGPYILTIGKITNKTTGNGLLEWIKGEDNGPVWQARPVERTAVVVDLPLAAWWNDGLNRGESKLLWAFKSVASELLKSLNYLTALLALLGLCYARHRFREPGMRLLCVYSGLQLSLLFTMAAKIGYVSERHTLILVLLGSLFAAFGLGELVVRANRFYRERGVSARWRSLVQRGLPISCAVLVAISLPSALKPLHGNRAGHHAAGLWLAKNATPEEVIWDPFAWAEFYAGRSMYVDPIRDYTTKTTYTILEPFNPNPHSKLPMIPTAKAIAEKGQVVYHWPEQGPLEKAKVVIYKAPPRGAPFQE